MPRGAVFGGAGSSLYPPSLVYGAGQAGVDVAITAINTFTDACSINLTQAGTYLVWGQLQLHSSLQAPKPTVRIWEKTGISIYVEAEDARSAGTAGDFTIPVGPTLVQIIAAKTLTLSVAVVTLGTSPLIKANAADNSAGNNNATWLVALRIA